MIESKITFAGPVLLEDYRYYVAIQLCQAAIFILIIY